MDAPLLANFVVANCMVDHAEAPDRVLVEQAQTGDIEAFDELVRRYQQKIANVLFRFCPHQADLPDLVQETMIKAFRKLDTKRAEAPFDRWLTKIAINTGHDYFRKGSREPTRLAGKDCAPNEDPDAKLEQKASESPDVYESYTEEVQKILSALDADDRLLITLQYLQELPLTEIAEHMEWSVSKTKVRSYRARKKLQTALKAYGISAESI